jgi:hypothetical protein
MRVPVVTLPAASSAMQAQRPAVPVPPGRHGCKTPGELAVRAASRPVSVPSPTSDHASPNSPSEHICPGQFWFGAGS